MSFLSSLFWRFLARADPSDRWVCGDGDFTRRQDQSFSSFNQTDLSWSTFGTKMAMYIYFFLFIFLSSLHTCGLKWTLPDKKKQTNKQIKQKVKDVNSFESSPWRDAESNVRLCPSSIGGVFVQRRAHTRLKRTVSAFIYRSMWTFLSCHLYWLHQQLIDLQQAEYTRMPIC